jgi:hypothetical protein
MKMTLLLINASFLFLTTAMYLGTGWSMWLFQFPVAPHLTPATYYWVFVPQVAAATQFFTVMTWLMIASSLVMIWTEWKGTLRWVPIVVFLGILGATGVTIWLIFPYNDAMTKGITDPAQLGSILASWIKLNRVRVLIWSVQWSAMMFYFARLALVGKQNQAVTQ